MAGKESENKLVAAVRIRGRVGVRDSIAETLERLRLPRPNSCALIRPNEAYIGMLKKCNNYVAYGEIDETTLKILLDKRAKGMDAKAVMDGSYATDELKKKMPIRLHAPRHGYRRGTKLGFAQGGSLGNVGAEINDLIKRMV